MNLKEFLQERVVNKIDFFMLDSFCESYCFLTFLTADFSWTSQSKIEKCRNEELKVKDCNLKKNREFFQMVTFANFSIVFQPLIFYK